MCINESSSGDLGLSMPLSWRPVHNQYSSGCNVVVVNSLKLKGSCWGAPDVRHFLKDHRIPGMLSATTRTKSSAHHWDIDSLQLTTLKPFSTYICYAQIKVKIERAMKNRLVKPYIPIFVLDLICTAQSVFWRLTYNEQLKSEHEKA